MFATLALIACGGLAADGVSVKFASSGATAKTGGYSPIRAEMDAKPDSVKKAPEGLTAPKYGALKLGEKSYSFIVDDPEGKNARLIVDSNGDGDLTNDPPSTWTRNEGGGALYNGQTVLDLGDGKQGTVKLYRFDPNDARRATLKNTLLYYTDFGQELTLTLDGQTFTTFVSGLQVRPTTRLWIDRDGNKERSSSKEMVTLGKPFNFTGTTYVLNLAKDGFSLEKATESLPVAPLPPDLGVGKKALPFETVATDGTKIDFPKTYAGKLVMLDFWATWCGPCIAELPNVKKAYADHHDKGYEILGISFDQENMAEKLKTFTKDNGMPWRQIYEGKYWNTTLGEQYDVSGIPFVLLVDGDTGEIIATEENLRGPGLSEFIGKALAKKNPKQ